MNVRPIDENSDSTYYHIRPEDIDVTKHFFSAFGQAEIEIAAQYIVRFCQKLKAWKAFSKEELDEFYKENGGREEHVFRSWRFWNDKTLEWFCNETGISKEQLLKDKDSFPFYWLGERLLVQRSDDKYCVTNFFINRCFHASPNRKSS